MNVERSTWGGACLLLSFAVLSFFFGDRWVAELLAPHQSLLKYPAQGASFLISPLLYLAGTGLGTVVIKNAKGKKRLRELFVMQGLSFVFVRLLKVLLGRARPLLFLQQKGYGFYGVQWGDLFHSFPSGHTMAAFALAIPLTWYFPRYRFLFVSVAALLAVSRLLLLDHFVSDLLGTVAIALVLSRGMHRWGEKVLSFAISSKNQWDKKK